MSLLAIGQGSTCTVKAKIFPGSDTTVTDANSPITFINQSSNATNHKFIVDTYFEFTLDTLEYYFPVGLHRVQLVASNGPCTDTITVFVFNPGTQPANRNSFKAFYGVPAMSESSNSIVSLTDGSYILGGYGNYNYRTLDGDYSLIMKIEPTGCIDWSRKIKNHWYNQEISKMIPTRDGGFVAVLGYKDLPSAYMKMDATGNLLWSKEITAGAYGATINAITETSDGGFIFKLLTINDLIVFIRVDRNGNIIWCKNIVKDYLYYSDLGCILEKDQAVYIGGLVATKNGDSYAYESIIFKLDFNTGNLIWANKYADVVNIESMTILQNDIFVTGANEKAATQGRRLTGIFSIDQSGAVIKSYNAFTGSPASGRAKLLPRSDGGFYIFKYGSFPLSLQPYVEWESVFTKINPDFTVDWSATYGDAGRNYYNDAAVGKNDELIALGDEVGTSIDYLSLSWKFMLQKFDSQNPYACYLNKDSVYLTPQPIDVIPYAINAQQNVQVSVSDLPLAVKTAYTENRYVCPTEFLDSCSVIRMNGPTSLCSLSDTLTYRIFRNNKCVQPVEWVIPAGVTVISQSNTAIRVKFPAYNEYKIFAKLPYSCIPVIDSVVVLVAPKGGLSLDLGPDKSLCAGNTELLKAGSGFLGYDWNSGSKDSILTVNAPGKYWVSVLDSCNNVLTDTITISAAPPVPLSIGADRVKCNNDTLHLDAPPGFLSYKWSPDYNISSILSPNVIVSPQQDTSYFLKAEKTPGCFGYDTILVRVKTSPSVYLGADTSFCHGDSIRLDAGPGFGRYLWNNQAGSQQFVVKTKGIYTVAATSINGCNSYDTLNVINVYKNPVVTLNHDSTLCLGAARMLTPGNFASYLWNNGSTAANISVNSTGYYSVKVSDNHNCWGFDSVSITRILPTPSDFFDTDSAAICLHSSLDLTTRINFKSYLWSDNSTFPSLRISEPGIYRIQVTDFNNCKGFDSIVVLLKTDCNQGFYIPSAFTPNNDGKNDVFRPLLFGDVQEYQFTIYNKWGQAVFQSNEPGRGWSGSVNEIPQHTGVFVWICSYRLTGEKLEIKRGTVTLIR